MRQCPDAPYTLRELVDQWSIEDAAIAREIARIEEVERSGIRPSGKGISSANFFDSATPEQRRRGARAGGRASAGRTAPSRRNTSGVVGVSRRPGSSTWRAKYRGRQLGAFRSKEEAAAAVQRAREAVAA